ncbi:crotonase/enoyl-CoA hydratase family protein [Parvibaculaceae bacterium PLY_AMNH_Bact1]|nr:crotonase/enoyl-CoA hydratase family protein [Parvibaculaceae bacterium PLY_AMNH_Bact1]
MTGTDITGTDKISFEVRGHVALIGINRPDKMNAFDADMLVGIDRAYMHLHTNDDLRAGVLHGHGKAFTAGLDLMSVAGSLSEEGRGRPDDQLDPYGLETEPCSKPVVMAAHGRCYTLGIELALASDICVAAEGTIFAQLEVARGIFPFAGASWRFAEQCGWGNAMRYVLTADQFDAEEALRIGLVQEVAAPDQVLNRAVELATRIATMAPLGIRTTLGHARKAALEGEAAAYADVAPQRVKVFASEDVKEGITAMMERREPQFQGR